MYPFFGGLYKLIDEFTKIADKHRKEKIKYIKFKLKTFIEYRNILTFYYNKVETMFSYYIDVINDKHLKKERMNKKIPIKSSDTKIKKLNKTERRILGRKRRKTIKPYPSFQKIIQVFDAKGRKFKGTCRNSFRKILNIKTIKKYQVNEEIIKFKLDNFEHQIRDIKRVLIHIENHIHFFINEFPLFRFDFDSISMIQQY